MDDRQRALDDYDQMADVYADDADIHPLNVAYDRPAILEMAGDVRGKRVLDVGCAAGALTDALVERGAAVVGIDLNPGLVDRARERLGQRAEFHVADLSAPLPFLPDRSFDLVTASLVLHYLADWRQPLAELNRVLRPGGILVISTHHPTLDIHLADPPAPYFATVLLNDTWRKGGREFEVSFYHRPISAIVDAVANAGFLIERIPEPVPDRAAFIGNLELYDRMTRGPWFLFIRAIKTRDVSAGMLDLSSRLLSPEHSGGSVR
jgi:ubiquinone/menaquinone biosynthesis C-methylase UbiE